MWDHHSVDVPQSDAFDAARPCESTIQRKHLDDGRLPVVEVRKVAAGRFSEEQFVDAVTGSDGAFDPDEYTWVELRGRTQPARNLFVAQVVGESMNRRIENGAYCLFRLNPHGTRQGMVVLAQHRFIHDTDFGGHFTIKVYESEKEHSAGGTWRHRRIILKPDSIDPAYKPIILENLQDGEAVIVAELAGVITPEGNATR